MQAELHHLDHLSTSLIKSHQVSKSEDDEDVLRCRKTCEPTRVVPPHCNGLVEVQVLRR